MNQTREPNRKRHTWPALAGATSIAVGLITLAAPSGALGTSKAATTPPVAVRDEVGEVLDLILGDRFPAIRVWPESYDRWAFPNRCSLLAPLPCS